MLLLSIRSNSNGVCDTLCVEIVFFFPLIRFWLLSAVNILWLQTCYTVIYRQMIFLSLSLSCLLWNGVPSIPITLGIYFAKNIPKFSICDFTMQKATSFGIFAQFILCRICIIFSSLAIKKQQLTLNCIHISRILTSKPMGLWKCVMFFLFVCCACASANVKSEETKLKYSNGYNACKKMKVK